MKKFNIAKQSGQILVALTVTVPALVLIVAAYLGLSLSSFRAAKHDQFQTHAQLSADAGVDLALKEINVDANYAGTNGETELHNDGSTKTTYAVSVDSSDPNVKIVTATGRSYSPVSSATAGSTVKLQVNLRPVQSGTYSIVSGQGGLRMSNSSKIIGGNVLINGEVTMSNSAQIGLSTNPVNVSVANQICPIPANATYPRLCNAGENNNPIEISNSAHIYGDVKANHQTNGSGMTDPGLTAGSGVNPEPLPSYDRDAQKAAVATTISSTAASCSGSQTKTWAANTKVSGNATLSNGCAVTVNGNIWITGNLYLSNLSKLIIADSLGSTRPVIMVDGSSGAIFSNASKIISNASGTGAQVIAYWSTASCSPDCTDVTGTDLNNSRSRTTIALSNSSQGAQSIFYARWTQVNLSNGGQVGAIVGQTIYMSNTSIVTFGAAIGGGGTSAWVIDSYRRIFN